jgi:hypothetical protein
MWNPPTEIQLSKLPTLYSTERVPLEEKIVHMHLFLGNTDWWICEYDAENRLFWGFVCLNGDVWNAEWGYTSLDELLRLKAPGGIEVDRELRWKPKPVKEIPRIMECCQCA